jgi:hypothetical protein
MQGNNITHLAANELARVSINLKVLELDRNPIVAVSDGAFSGIGPNTSLTMGQSPTVCRPLLSGPSLPKWHCDCAPGYSSDINWPAYCGMLFLFFNFRENALISNFLQFKRHR